MTTSREEAIGSLAEVKGVGEVRAGQLYDELGVTSVEELVDAATRGELVRLKGVGAKKQQSILESARAHGAGTEAVEVVVADGGAGQGAEAAEPEADARDMWSRVLDDLVCPNCGAEGMESAVTVTCKACRREYLVQDGVMDLAPPYARRGGWAQRVMETRFYSSYYEDVMRPRLTGLVSGRTMAQEMMLSAELLELREGARVLDVACGTGNFTRHFAQELEALGGASALVGMDLSWPMLEEAVRFRARDGWDDALVLVRGDATRMPFKRATFDRLHCTAALHLMSDIDGALRNFARVLVPGGVCVIGTFTRESNGLRGWLKKATPGRVRFHWFTREELRDRIGRAGFEVELESVSRDAITVKARRR